MHINKQEVFSLYESNKYLFINDDDNDKSNQIKSNNAMWMEIEGICLWKSILKTAKYAKHEIWGTYFPLHSQKFTKMMLK